MEERKEEKKPEQSSVFVDILRQAKDEILVPRLLDTANSTGSQIIYGFADFFVNSMSRRIYANSGIQPKAITRNGSDNRGKYATTAKTQPQPKRNDIGSRSSSVLEYVVISPDLRNPKDLKDRLDESDYDGRKKAESIKNELIKSIKDYERARLADLYELSGKYIPSITDYSYGWTDVSDIHYIRNSDGWWFNMPNPTKLVK